MNKPMPSNLRTAENPATPLPRFGDDRNRDTDHSQDKSARSIRELKNSRRK